MIKKKGGGATVEMVLILTILTGTAYMVLRGFETHKPIHHFVAGPWKALANMMESGSWTTDGTEAKKNHPNHFERMFTEEGKSP